MEESTKNKILITAQDLFISKGFSGTTMRDIASSANINKGLLHYYFQSKKILFENVLQLTTFQLIPKIDNIIHLDIKMDEKIELIVDEYVEFLLKNPKIPPFMINEMNNNTEIFLNSIRGSGINSKVGQIAGELTSQLKKNSKIEPIHFYFNLLSLLLYPFLMRPLIENIVLPEKDQFVYLMRLRKKIVVDIIVKHLNE